MKEKTHSTYSVGMAASLLKVTVKTLQRWDKSKKLVSCRLPSGRRYYTADQLNNLMATLNLGTIDDINSPTKTSFTLQQTSTALKLIISTPPCLFSIDLTLADLNNLINIITQQD